MSQSTGLHSLRTNNCLRANGGLRMETTIDTENTGTILKPNFEPDGVISDPDIASNIIREINPQMAHPGSPEINVVEWERIIEFFSPELFTHIAKETSFNDREKCFTALSIRFDEDTPFEISDLIDVSCGPEVDENRRKYRNHVLSAYEYALNVLPPVTSALVGGWLGQVRVFDPDYYKDEVLPDGKRWGGMHYPYRQEIQISMNCWNKFGDFEYPKESRTHSCTMLHELAHVVHNIYGFYRPGDSGYEYPSKKTNPSSTGCISPINLSDHQAKFVYEMIRSYTLHHRDAFDDVHYSGYCRTHPAEAFACAFERLLRRGETEFLEDYEQFVDVMSLMR